ncbi:MAG: tail-specific protease [Cryomorphaceae bacterium MED-G14]|nr:MAG: tail-specific protease [Cryomorphaceae bacterium MED-G14]|tara:strand:+ start:200 stop:2296 length:2097 start_codon:yes stop_codon:yes gene_type:complete
MNKKFEYLFLLIPLLIIGFTITNKNFSDPNKDRLLIEIIKYVVEKGHYNKIQIDDDLSEKIYLSFIDKLDKQKRFFLKSDLKNFEKYKYRLDDQIKNYDLTFFNLVYETLKLRSNEVQSYYKEILAKPFDFKYKEELNLDFENKDFSKNKSEIKQRWRKQLKFSTLDISLLKLGDSISTINDRIYNESLAIVKKNTEDFFEFYNDMDRDDWFSSYINSFLNQLDPHTFYFQPDDKERFDVNISGKFNGIGARLTKTEGSIKIVEIIIGGPIWKDNLLNVGDVILKVAQDNSEPIDVVGMKLDDAIKLIKGPAKSFVTLTVKKIDGSIKDVSIMRDLVELEEIYAKSTLINKENINYGYISLPKFYVDFSDYKNRNSSEDVKNHIIKLKNNGMKGLILDLRNNGGGSLQTVVDMTGLFIEKGPVVQVKSIGNRKKILYDRNPEIIWDGPLVILINEMSASASEILAAALQDYKRAVIIGSKKSFGKGTVQNIIDLNKFISNSDFDMGAIKITTDKFYRINGESVQLEGVKSDVVIPDSYMHIFNGEKDENNPLKWDKIDAAFYNPWNGFKNFSFIKNNAQSRINSNNYLKLISKRADWIKEQSENKLIPLNFSVYKDYVENNKKRNKLFESISEYSNNLNFKLLKSEKDFIMSNKDLLSNRNRWHKNLKKDIFISEGVNVLEQIFLNKSKSEMIIANKE